MRIVAALGSRAILRRGEAPDAEAQRGHIVDAAAALAPVAEQHELIVTHGNGAQEGLLGLESADDPSLERTYPRDALDAQTQGLIGYWLVEALQRELPDYEVACLLTPIAVDSAVIGHLVAPKVVVVYAGGEGVAVLRERHGSRQGVEAVADEDRTAALLAEQVGADRLLLLTDVNAVMDGWGTAAPRSIARAGVGWFRRREFASGSMGPKVDAACWFVERTGRTASIGAVEQVETILAGRAGTDVVARATAIG